MNFLPRWDIETIEAVGPDASNMGIVQHTRSQKQCGNVALMAHVLDTCGHYTYANSQGVPE